MKGDIEILTHQIQGYLLTKFILLKYFIYNLNYYIRGEIYIGGDNVAMGYYNLPDKTAEDFKTINGIRYFATGDIGEMINGNLKIIDRKKDLVKLSGGEYVSLNKVETSIKLLSFVDNCCVVADGLQSNCVCLISPNHKKISELLVENKENQADLEKINELNSIFYDACVYFNIFKFIFVNI